MLEILEDRSTPTFIDLGALTFDVPAFTSNANGALVTGGVVQLGFKPEGSGDSFRGLLNLNLDAIAPGEGTLQINTANGGTTFDLEKGSVVLTAVTGIATPIWQTTESFTFDTNSLLSLAGQQIEGSGDPIAFDALTTKFSTSYLLLLNDSGNGTQDTYVGLQGQIGFDFQPQLKIEVINKNYLYAQGNGFTLTGVEANLTTPRIDIKGMSVFNAGLRVAYNSDHGAHDFTITGGFNLASGDGNLTSNVAGGGGANLTLKISDGHLAQLGGTLNTEMKIFSTTMTAKDVSFTADLGSANWTFAGNLTVAVKTKADPDTTNGFDIILGSPTGNTPGLVVQDSQVQNITAYVDANFQFWNLKFNVIDELDFMYTRDLQQFQLTGGVRIDVGNTNPVQLTVDLPFNNGQSGLIIKDDRLIQFDGCLTAGFTAAGLKANTTTLGQASVTWSEEPGNDVLTIVGKLMLDNVFHAAIDFGSSANQPGIRIIDGEVQFDGLTINLEHIPLGAFEVQNLTIGFDRDIVTNVWTFGADLQLLFPGGWAIGGNLSYINGNLNSIEIDFSANSTDAAIPLGDSGVYLVYADISVTNIDVANAPLTVAGDVAMTYGPQETTLVDPNAPGDPPKAGSILAVQGSFLANKDQISVNGGVYAGALVVSRDPATNRPTYEGLIGQGTGAINLDWAAKDYSARLDLSLLRGAFTFQSDVDFTGTAGSYTLFISADAELKVPDFIPVIGGLKIASADFLLDYLDDDGTKRGLIAAWIDVLGEVIGFEYDITTGHWSLIGKKEVAALIDCEANPELCLVGNGPYTYQNIFTAPAGATGAILNVDWPEIASNQTLAVVFPNGTRITQDQFPTANITLLANISTPTKKSVLLVGDATNKYTPLATGNYTLQLSTPIKFDEHPEFTSGFRYPEPTATVASANNDATDGNLIDVTVTGLVDPAFVGDLTLRLFIDPNTTGYDGTSLPIANLTRSLAAPPLGSPTNAAQYTLTGQIDLTNKFFQGYYIYTTVSDGVNAPVYSAYTSTPVSSEAPINGQILNAKATTGTNRVSGITVYIDVNDDGVYEADVDPAGISTSSGGYTVTDPKNVLISGNFYNLRLDLPPGTSLDANSTTPNPKNFQFVTGDTLGFDYLLDLSAGLNGSVLANLTAGTVGVQGLRVYVDYNQNGHFDTNEPFTLSLSQGDWHIYGLPLNQALSVRIDIPDTYYANGPTTLGNYTLTAPFEQISNIDFQVLPKERIHGTVSGNLLGNDGVLSPTSSNLANWTIRLLQNGTVLQTTRTNSQGYYQFLVEDGNYTVAQVVPDGWRQLKPFTPTLDIDTTPSITGLGFQPGTVAVADFDNDGHADLVVTNNTFGNPGNVHILWGDGSGQFSINNSLTLNASSLGSMNILIGDTTGTGRADILLWNDADDQGAVFLIQNNGGRNFSSPNNILNVYNQIAVNGYNPSIDSFDAAIGDLNNDGRDDVMLTWYADSSNIGYSTWFAGSGSTSFHYVDSLTSPIGGLQNAGDAGQGLTRIVDLRNNGDKDFVFAGYVANSNNNLSVGLNNSGGNSFSFVNFPFEKSTNYSFADIDGDGILDLLYLDATNQNYNVVGYQHGNGDGTFSVIQSQQPYTNLNLPYAGNEYINTYLTDLNGDLKPEVLVFGANTVGQSFSWFGIWVNKGDAPYYSADQQLVRQQLENLAYLPSSAIGDVNGDGLTDILVADAPNNNIRIYFNKTTVNTTDYSVTVLAGETANATDFSNGQIGQINGVTYEDGNRNGSRDAGDAVLAGVQVFLDLNNNDVLDANETVATTGQDGAYAFSGLANGTYTVRVLPLVNHFASSASVTVGAGAKSQDFALLQRWLKPIADQTAEPGQPFHFTIETTGFAVDPSLRFSLVSAPSGSAIDPQTGLFTWNASDTPVYYSFTVKYSSPFNTLQVETATFRVLVPAPRAGAPAPLPPVNFTPAPLPPGAPTLSSTPNYAAFPLPPDSPTVYVAIGTGDGWVRVFDYGSDLERFRFQPFGNYSGGVRVATADVTGDGIPDIITGAGPGGGPHVKVYDGSNGNEVASFYAFESSFTGGVFVAGGDLNGDDRADIIVTPDAGGGPVIAVFDGITQSRLATVYAFESSFMGGLRVAAGDIDNDGAADVIVMPGIGGSSRVAGFDGASLALGMGVRLFNDFYAFVPDSALGYYPTLGDANADGYSDLFIATGAGVGPRVVGFDGRALALTGSANMVASFYAASPGSPYGLQIKAADLDGDGRTEIVAAEGAGTWPILRVYAPLTGNKLDEFYAWIASDLTAIEVG